MNRLAAFRRAEYSFDIRTGTRSADFAERVQGFGSRRIFRCCKCAECIDDGLRRVTELAQSECRVHTHGGVRIAQCANQ